MLGLYVRDNSGKDVVRAITTSFLVLTFQIQFKNRTAVLRIRESIIKLVVKMPSRGSYDITSPEEGKTVQSDQSYRSCVCTLLIFFFLCIILILATLPWKKSYHHSSEGSDKNLETMQVSFFE